MKIGIDVRKIRDTGIGTYIRSIVRAMLEIDPDDRFVLFGYEQDRNVISFSGERVRWLPTTAGKYSLMEHVSLPYLARGAGIDVFHSPHYTLPLTLRSPSVVTIHDCIHVKFPEYLPTSFHHAYARFMARSAARRARIVITVSHTSREDIVSLLGVDENRVKVIHNGVDEEFFASEEEPAPRQHILVVSSPKPHKNLIGAVAAYSLVADRIPQDLLIVGERPEDVSPVVGLVRQRGLEERVRFCGRLEGEALSNAYREALLLLSLSYYEGFGLPVLEAMASGVPVVLSRVASHPEVAGDAGLFVDPDDHRGAAEAMMKLIGDEEAREGLIRKGRERARLFPWRKAAEATLECYREACG